MDSDYTIFMNPSPINVFADHVFYFKIEMKKHEAVCTAACAYLAMLKSCTSMHFIQAWAADLNLGPVQVFPFHILQYLFSYLLDADLFKKAKYWPWINVVCLVIEVKRNRCDCSASVWGVPWRFGGHAINNFTARNRNGLFEAISFMTKEATAYYYGTLARSDFEFCSIDNSTHRVGVMSVSQKWLYDLLKFEMCCTDLNLPIPRCYL